jgi:hypothetical protein
MGVVRRARHAAAAITSVRVAAVAAALAGCIAGGSVVVTSATGAASPAHRARAASASAALQPKATQRGSLVHGFNGDDAEGRIANLTPYTWTLAETGRNGSNVENWDKASIPATVKPGESFVYRLHPYGKYATTRQYSGFFTYRADTLNHAEYLTLDLEGTHCTGICFARDGPGLVPKAFNATAAPRHNNVFQYDFGPSTPNPEIGWTSSGSANVFPNLDSDFDFTFQTRGTYTLDAAKAPPQLSALINAMCAGGAGTKCSFTPIGSIHWGIGDLDKQTSVKSCGAEPPEPSGSRQLGRPPAEDPDWHEVSVEAKRKRSVSIGGSLTGSAEVHLFGVIDSEVSAKIGIEHEWSDTKTFEKTTRIFVPQDWIAGVWVAPVVGKISGTLVVSTSLATYTITNFEEVATGVSRDLLTPAFNIITSSRQMTVQEYHSLCGTTEEPPPSGGLG